ncbi:hypothetical protein GGR56DRAFT_687796 [Xylariaceae sp. FL0804]|nr:hypothetical protein GGR56DRAFT_687796 [Xylariaceae sp. FL0804]
MTRPQIIRADSIDLQDHDAPSAKEHKHPALHLTTDATSSLAPHQAETIREVQEERAEEEGRSPRVSWANGDGHSDRDLQQYADDLRNGMAESLDGSKMQQQDAQAVAQNGRVADDGDMDADGDDMDDDMMDKISSSPSIDDGGYTLPPVWPARVDSLRHSLSQCEPPSSPVGSEARSSSPYLDLAEHEPLRRSPQQASKASSGASEPCHHPPVFAPTTQETEMNETSHHLEGLASQTPLHSNRESGIDVRIEDFSLDRPPSAHDELDQDHILSPYDLAPYDALEEDSDHEDDHGNDRKAGDDNDNDDDISFSFNARFVDSGWGGECLQETEDIDFEFVYALHTFVATVEGQANASKGDTMVLLDDSNSYWWLVRVVKDSSIGYLPAEHIETPTERLARLNKHRNIDLSATMLGDQAEKTKNPIKTAIRRRKKTVTFTAPTYVDYSDFDYSTDEEGGEGEVQTQQQVVQQQGQQRQQQVTVQSVADETAEEDESARPEPLKPRGQKQVRLDVAQPEETVDAEPALERETSRNSDDIFDAKTERTTKNGTVRNTDSFFKDETIETKKITLTPGLLRDDDESRVSNDSSTIRQRPSFEKDLVSDKSKDEKKKKKEKERDKDKKPSAIRSFFSRKDKKKSADEDDESFGKRSMDAGSGYSEKDALDETEPMDPESSPEKGPQRSTGKLQKQQHPRVEPSPTRKATSATQQSNVDRTPMLAAEVKTNNVANVPPATLRMVEDEQPETQESHSPREERLRSAISKVLPTSSEPKEPKPPKVTKAKSRVELDDFDSPSEDEGVPEPTRIPPEPQRQLTDEKPLRPVLPGSFPDSYISTPTPQAQPKELAPVQRAAEERLSESPIEVSPITTSHPPGLMVDTSSPEDRSSLISSPTPEPEDVDKTHRNQDSVTTTSPTATSTWNDDNLRAFFDSGSEIRELLTVVYDNSDVPPAGPDHPVAGTLFREQNAKLAEITTQLDNMLGDWLARKQRVRGTV